MADIVDVAWRRETQIRSKILGEVLRYVARRPEPVSYEHVFDEALGVVGLSEEEVGHEILLATNLLVRSGLIVCNGFNEADDTLTIGADTMLGRGKRLSDFMRAPF